MSKFALEGYRVVDFGWVAAGPILGSMLANMGAEVIKIESSTRMDSMRMSPDNLEKDPEKDPWFHSIHRNKLGITVDMAKPKGVEVLKNLVKKSDMVIENFSPNVMPKFGLDYESLRKVKDDIIMVSLPATGSEGPLSDVITYGMSLQGLCGLESLVGYRGERVLGMQQAYCDWLSAIVGAYSLVLALYHRNQTGEGQYIEVAQMETALSIMNEPIMDYHMNGRIMKTQGNFSPFMAPHGNYPCKGDDKWVAIAIKTEGEWKSLCDVMGNPAWTKENKFVDKKNRLENLDELDAHMSEWTKSYTHYEVMEMLQKVEVAAMPCLDMEERFSDPQLQARDVYVSLEHPVSGMEYVTNVPWKMSETPGGIVRPAPMMGQHNDYVFKELLGMSQEQVDKLTEEKVFF